MRNSPGDWWQYGAWWPFIMTASSSETSSFEGSVGFLDNFFHGFCGIFGKKKREVEKKKSKLIFGKVKHRVPVQRKFIEKLQK